MIIPKRLKKITSKKYQGSNGKQAKDQHTQQLMKPASDTGRHTSHKLKNRNINTCPYF